jgi:transcriptional regulator with XRE-family HTH domain
MAGEFAVVLRYLRRQRNLTIRELATETGIHYVQLAHYESGAYLPKVDKVYALSAPLQVKATDLATIIRWEKQARVNGGRSIDAEKFLAAWLMNLY